MVPANRWGHANFSATQLKIIQEVVTLGVQRVRHRLARRSHPLEHLAAVAFKFLPVAWTRNARSIRRLLRSSSWSGNLITKNSRKSQLKEVAWKALRL